MHYLPAGQRMFNWYSTGTVLYDDQPDYIWKTRTDILFWI